jgi:hypothetical protein
MTWATPCPTCVRIGRVPLGLYTSELAIHRHQLAHHAGEAA